MNHHELCAEPAEPFELRQQLEQQRLDKSLSEVCGRLRRRGIELVSIPFDGCSDSGVLQDPIARRGDAEVRVSRDLQEQLLDVAAELLPVGWDVNQGSQGELVLAVDAERAICHHRWRSQPPAA